MCVLSCAAIDSQWRPGSVNPDAMSDATLALAHLVVAPTLGMAKLDIRSLPALTRLVLIPAPVRLRHFDLASACTAPKAVLKETIFCDLYEMCGKDVTVFDSVITRVEAAERCCWMAASTQVMTLPSTVTFFPHIS